MTVSGTSSPNNQNGLLNCIDIAATATSAPSKEEILLAEAKALRQHKGRLEQRMEILEDHNQQLESQLQRLRQLLEAEEQDPIAKSATSPQVVATNDKQAGNYVNGNGNQTESKNSLSGHQNHDPANGNTIVNNGSGMT